MLLLRALDKGDGRAERAYRLYVKERLWRFNYVRVPSFRSSPLAVLPLLSACQSIRSIVFPINLLLLLASLTNSRHRPSSPSSRSKSGWRSSRRRTRASARIISGS